MSLPHALASTECASCEAGALHCHGTAVVHRGGRLGCSDDPSCPKPEEAHAYVILCVELDGGCC